MKSILTQVGTTCRVVLISGLLAASAFASDPSSNAAPNTGPNGPGNAWPLCSMATFSGDYGFTVNGTITPGGGVVIYISGVQMIHSDGNGNLSDTEALVLNGVPLVDAPPSYFSLHTGTYTVNSNCTGLAYLSNVSEGGVNFIWLSFVIDKAGKQIRMVGVPPFDSGGTARTVVSVGEKVEETPQP
jgi:hypothetical protein